MIYVQCQASGYRNTNTPPFEERGSIGGQRFLVGLYLEGDEQAKQIAQRLAASEQNLRNVALANRRAIQRQAYPSTAYRVGRLISVVEPKIPADWLSRVVFAPASTDLEEYLHRLPDEVLGAAEQFVSAKRELAMLTGQIDQSARH
jgi:GGDEF domain-containing protein